MDGRVQWAVGGKQKSVIRTEARQSPPSVAGRRPCRGKPKPLRFTEVVPAHAGHFDDREALGAKRQHLMRKI